MLRVLYVLAESAPSSLKSQPQKCLWNLSGNCTLLVGRGVKKPPNVIRDGLAFVFQREVTGVKQVQLGIWQVALIGLGPFHGKEGIVLSPDNQHGRLMS